MERLRKEAQKTGIALSDGQIEKFKIYDCVLREYNAVMNLTAIKDEYEVIIKHYLDSLTLLKTGLINAGSSVVDIGAGAGFPSLPCAIAFPEASFTMLDSLGKRVSFLNEAVKRAGINNACAFHMRAEDAGRDETFRERFDIAAARAVADLRVLAEYALPLVKVGGFFLAMKGSDPEGEIDGARRAVGMLGGRIKNVIRVDIEPLSLSHSIVVIEKKERTENIFPRKAGIPAKKPL